MDGKFESRVIDELRSLLNAFESGCQPQNIELSHVVIVELRRQERTEAELERLSH